MRTLSIDENKNNKKLIQVITGVFPDAPLSSIHKALRRKDIKINGKRIKEDVLVKTGDLIEIYIDDSILINEPSPEIMYEDKNILIVNKPQGLKVHPDKDSGSGSLIEILQNIYGKETALCHRLDRNTGGLIIAGLNKESTEIILNKIKNNEIMKIYRCRVHGRLNASHKVLTAYHTKNAKDSIVFISETPSPYSSKIITEYKVIDYDPKTDTSVLEINLVTGKTHQIRAHMAHIGHPVVGDGKYGSNEIKKKLGEKHKYHALFACKIIFAFTSPAGKLSYLKDKTVQIKSL